MGGRGSTGGFGSMNTRAGIQKNWDFVSSKRRELSGWERELNSKKSQLASYASNKVSKENKGFLGSMARSTYDKKIQQAKSKSPLNKEIKSLETKIANRKKSLDEWDKKLADAMFNYGKKTKKKR